MEQIPLVGVQIHKGTSPSGLSQESKGNGQTPAAIAKGG